MTDTLKPCPFCGDRLQRSYSERWIHSRPAKCILGDFYVYDDKVAAWNRRPPPQEAAKECRLTMDGYWCDEHNAKGRLLEVLYCEKVTPSVTFEPAPEKP